MKENTTNKEPSKLIKELNFDLLLLVTFFTGVILIISTYAWFSSSLNVKINFFNIVAVNNTGLYISLDGVDYVSTVSISEETIIDGLNRKYPTHTNQYARRGLSPVSTNGIKNTNADKFSIYTSSRLGYKINDTTRKRYLNTVLVPEDTKTNSNVFIAFDIFLKNISGSPKSDNLYLDNGTRVYLKRASSNDTAAVVNSVRFGFLRVGSVERTATVNEIQTMTCNNDCEMVIYEPNSSSHSQDSITRVKQYGVNMANGRIMPTYAVINTGRYLDFVGGQQGSGVPLDREHFTLQNTIKGFNNPIFQIPDGITKVRVYVWLEGQDMDSIEALSKGSVISLAINFIKDYAGYE